MCFQLLPVTTSRQGETIQSLGPLETGGRGAFFLHFPSWQPREPLEYQANGLPATKISGIRVLQLTSRDRSTKVPTLIPLKRWSSQKVALQSETVFFQGVRSWQPRATTRMVPLAPAPVVFGGVPTPQGRQQLSVGLRGAELQLRRHLERLGFRLGRVRERRRELPASRSGGLDWWFFPSFLKSNK